MIEKMVKFHQKIGWVAGLLLYWIYFFISNYLVTTAHIKKIPLTPGEIAGIMNTDQVGYYLGLVCIFLIVVRLAMFIPGIAAGTQIAVFNLHLIFEEDEIKRIMNPSLHFLDILQAFMIFYLCVLVGMDQVFAFVFGTESEKVAIYSIATTSIVVFGICFVTTIIGTIDRKKMMTKILGTLEEQFSYIENAARDPKQKQEVYEKIKEKDPEAAEVFLEYANFLNEETNENDEAGTEDIPDQSKQPETEDPDETSNPVNKDK